MADGSDRRRRRRKSAGAAGAAGSAGTGGNSDAGKKDTSKEASKAGSSANGNANGNDNGGSNASAKSNSKGNAKGASKGKGKDRRRNKGKEDKKDDKKGVSKVKRSGRKNEPGPKNSKTTKKKEAQRVQSALEQDYKKLVVRLLPPMLTETQFWSTVGAPTLENKQQYFDAHGIVEHYFHQGEAYAKFATMNARKKSYSRMYLIFKDIDHAKKYVLAIKDLTFTDDHDNSNNPTFKISQYVKLFASGSTKQKSGSALEGTIDDDKIFKNFLKSMKYVREHQFEEDVEGISMLRPIEKELALKRERKELAEKAAQHAIAKLTGVSESDKKKKKRKKKKKGAVEETPKEKKKRKRNKKKKEKKKKASEGNEPKADSNNFVILEKAGKQVLKERLAKKGSMTALPALTPDKPKVPKILKRNI